MKAREFIYNKKALSYVTRVILGSIIVWWSLYYLHDNKKIWALISVLVVSDPDFENIRATAISRIINTITGCILGLVFIYLAGFSFLTLMSAITVSVFISTSFKKYPSSWKLAPTTVVIIMMPGIVENTVLKDATDIALVRTGEVLYGSLVAFALGFIFLYFQKQNEKHHEKRSPGQHGMHE